MIITIHFKKKEKKEKKKKRNGIIDIIYLFIFTSILICIIDIISFIAKNRIDLTI